jgi:hypothetical protein
VAEVVVVEEVDQRRAAALDPLFAAGRNLWFGHFDQTRQPNEPTGSVLKDVRAAYGQVCEQWRRTGGSCGGLFTDSHALLTDAVATLLDAGARDGSVRTDVTSDDVLLLMGGIAYAVQHGTTEQAGRLVDLFMDALTKDSAAH